MKSIDSFGQDIPELNLKGKKSVNTVLGGLLSASVFLVTLAYSSYKFISLMTKANPIINEIDQLNYFGNTDYLDLNEI